MALIDWIIIIVFLLVLTFIGFYFSKKNTDIHDYFLGGRKMPTLFVTFAAVGTSISAGTFIGAPQISFDENLTYIMLSVGGVIGGLLAASLILPTLYKANTITIYGFLEKRFGNSVTRMSSVFFLVGQLLTSGSRLFIASIAISVMLYNNILMENLIVSILILGLISTIYTVAGGIKGLIYIDTLQTVLILGSGIAAIVFLYNAIPSSFSDIFNSLSNYVSAEGVRQDKLQIFDTSSSLSHPRSLLSALIGCSIFKFAQYSTDQEFVQRQMTAKSAKKGAASLVYSTLVSLPIVLIFLIIGLLLFVYYQMPELMGGISYAGELTDSRQIFPQFIFDKIPAGLTGVMVIGLLAAALSSFNSSINGMSSSFVSDLYLPYRLKRNRKSAEASQLKQSRLISILIGIALTGFAILTAYMQDAGGQSLIDFSLGIMSFSYAGLLGVFLCAIFTKRGSMKSAIFALVTGFIVVIFLQPQIMKLWTSFIFGEPVLISWPWWVGIGGLFSFIVCCIGKNKNR